MFQGKILGEKPVMKVNGIWISDSAKIIDFFIFISPQKLK